MANGYGCRISGGARNWQIFQQDETGHAVISLHGSYSMPEAERPGVPLVRVVSEETQVPPSVEADWQRAKTRLDTVWQLEMKVPTGGSYRIETAVIQEDGSMDRASRGEVVHHTGVGDLWVIAGETRSVAFGGEEVIDPPEIGVHVFRGDRWDLAAHPLSDDPDDAPTALGSGNLGHSPFLRFGRELKRVLGYPVGLIYTAHADSPLLKWDILEDPGAPLFVRIFASARLAGYKVKGICWHQGWSDAVKPACFDYLSRFKEVVSELRASLQSPELPFLTAEIGKCPDRASDDVAEAWSMIREAQRQAAQTIDHVVLIPTMDLPLSDGIRISPQGNLILGDRYAAAALEKERMK